MDLPGPLIQQGLGNDDTPSSCVSWNACTKKSFPLIFLFFWLSRYIQCIQEGLDRIFGNFSLFTIFQNTVSVS